MSEGVEGAPDHDKALQWFLAAGNYGVRDSQYNLGVIYARGLGTTQDLVESYKWFAIAAAQGDTDASARRDEVAKAHDRRRPRQGARRGDRPGTSSRRSPKPTRSRRRPAAGTDPARPSARPTARRWSRRSRRCSPSRATTPARPTASPARRRSTRSAPTSARLGVPETGQIDKTLIASLSDRRCNAVAVAA